MTTRKLISAAEAAEVLNAHSGGHLGAKAATETLRRHDVYEQRGYDPEEVERVARERPGQGVRPAFLPDARSERIVQLRDADGLTWNDIAEQVGMSAKGARKRYVLHRDAIHQAWRSKAKAS